MLRRDAINRTEMGPARTDHTRGSGPADGAVDSEARQDTLDESGIRDGLGRFGHSFSKLPAL
jgi:hypothetical protein